MYSYFGLLIDGQRGYQRGIGRGALAIDIGPVPVSVHQGRGTRKPQLGRIFKHVRCARGVLPYRSPVHLPLDVGICGGARIDGEGDRSSFTDRAVVGLEEDLRLLIHGQYHLVRRDRRQAYAADDHTVEEIMHRGDRISNKQRIGSFKAVFSGIGRGGNIREGCCSLFHLPFVGRVGGNPCIHTEERDAVFTNSDAGGLARYLGLLINI